MHGEKMRRWRCENCLNLDYRHEMRVCLCTYQQSLKAPIDNGKRTEDYLWCKGQGYRDEQ